MKDIGYICIHLHIVIHIYMYATGCRSILLHANVQTPRVDILDIYVNTYMHTYTYTCMNIYMQKCKHHAYALPSVSHTCKWNVLQQNFVRLSALQKSIPFKVHGSGKFLDSLSPHPIAHVFSGLANMSKICPK